MARRSSRRAFDGQPVRSAALDAVDECCRQFRPYRDARVVLVRAPDVDVFTGIVGSYGKVTGTPHLLVFVADERGPFADQHVGFTGEGVVLEATRLGLDTCWVGGFFRAAKVRRVVDLAEGERVYAVSPLGYASQSVGAAERSMRGMAGSKKRKCVEELAPGIGSSWPEWAVTAVETARLAPSAVNRQPWRFRLEDGGLVIAKDSSFETPKVAKRLDCGIGDAPRRARRNGFRCSRRVDRSGRHRCRALRSAGDLVRLETRRALRWLWILPALLLLAAIGFVVWGLTPLGPTELALGALKSGGGVTVTQAAGGWAFSPSSSEPTAGLVLYPGGHVDARSYAPLAREIASRGYLVVVPKMPLSLAFFDVRAADKARATYPDIKTWAVGGHSLGGVAAAMYARSNPLSTRGLVLYASYPPSGTDLSASGLKAASITGTLDGVVDKQSLAASYPMLPADTDLTPIVGGNHAQFGSYGAQPGDNPATISPELQWQLAADAAQGVLARSAALR